MKETTLEICNVKIATIQYSVDGTEEALLLRFMFLNFKVWKLFSQFKTINSVNQIFYRNYFFPSNLICFYGCNSDSVDKKTEIWKYLKSKPFYQKILNKLYKLYKRILREKHLSNFTDQIGEILVFQIDETLSLRKFIFPNQHFCQLPFPLLTSHIHETYVQIRQLEWASSAKK